MNVFRSLLAVLVPLTLYSCAETGQPDLSISDLSTDAPYTMVSTTSALRSGGATCADGGVTIDTGFDANGNGLLDSEEIGESYTLCHGTDSNSNLIIMSDETAGDNCLFGGKKLEVGFDLNLNGSLESSEIEETEYFCSFVKTLVTVTSEPKGDNCSFGGEKLETGVDLNGDDSLTKDEVYSTHYVCINYNQLYESHHCRSALAIENVLTGMSLDYRIDEYLNGDIEVTAEIISQFVGISRNNRWSKEIDSHETFWNEGYVKINFDIINSPGNGGYWDITIVRGADSGVYITESDTHIVVKYFDEDINEEVGSPLDVITWELANFAECRASSGAS